jgi:hypothetical protein
LNGLKTQDEGVHAILRDHGESLATREIAVRALAAKGVTLPDRGAVKVTRLRLQNTFSA